MVFYHIPLYKTIFILDPDINFLRTIQDILENEGMLTVGFSQCETAFKSIEKTSPDLIIISHSPSDKKISNFLKFLSENKEDIPIILFTENYNAEKDLDLNYSGINKIFTKDKKNIFRYGNLHTENASPNVMTDKI